MTEKEGGNKKIHYTAPYLALNFHCSVKYVIKKKMTNEFLAQPLSIMHLNSPTKCNKNTSYYKIALNSIKILNL